MADKAAIGAHGRIGKLAFQKRLFARNEIVKARGAREDHRLGGIELFGRLCQIRKARFQLAVRAAAAIAADRVDRRIDAGTTGFGVLA
ncbi:hypothetical protein D3C80_1941660 [compost metagenome]